MIERRAVSRYARALFLTAKEQGRLEDVDREFAQTSQLVRKHPEISHLVLNSTIALAEKEDFIEKLVGSQTSPLLVNFVKVLIKKRRFTELEFIQQEFRNLFEKAKGIQEIEVVSAAPLSEALENQLCAALKKRLKAEIRLVAKTDPALMGGLVLRFDGTEMNASFKARLEEIKQRLT